MATSQVQTPVVQIDQDALDAWGWVIDFKHYTFAEEEPAELLAKMTESMRDDAILLAPQLIA